MAANLAVKTYKFPVRDIDEIVAAQQSGAIDAPICVLAGTAYARWLAAQYPLMNTLGIVGGEEVIAEAIQSGACAGAINTHPLSLATIHASPKFPLYQVGFPLRYGPQDMAAGVRADLVDVERVLSHWVTVLRFCNPLLPGDICYRDSNMQGLFARWFPPERTAPPPLTTESLGVSDFFYVILLVMSTAVGVVVHEFGSARMRDRLGAFLRPTLLEFLTTEYHGCFKIDQLVDPDKVLAHGFHTLHTVSYRDLCHRLPRCTVSYRRVPPCTATYRHLPPPTATYRHLPPPTVTYRHLPSPTATYPHLPSPTLTYPHLPSPIVADQVLAHGFHGPPKERENLLKSISRYLVSTSVQTSTAGSDWRCSRKNRDARRRCRGRGRPPRCFSVRSLRRSMRHAPPTPTTSQTASHRRV